MKYGRLTLLKPRRLADRPAWLCVCACGTQKVIRQKSLFNGETKSCGCLRRERSAVWAGSLGRQQVGSRNPLYRHGESIGYKSTAEYVSYRHAKARCNNPRNHKYRRYGGRGIEFRFTGFAQFLAEVGRRPGRGYTLDRIDNDGHYEPGNVRWATYVEQARNRSVA